MSGRTAAVTLLALTIACGNGSSSSGDAPPAGPETPWTEALGDACAAGMRPSVGLAACVPVGVPSCPDGFAPDPSGWGCRDVQPDARCDGATREVLGKTTCMPIGDCDAAFPPPGATLFVDASLAQEDATHKKTIGAAVAAATSGAVIAVERGSYQENVAVRIPLTIQGRCARDVLVTSPDGKGAGVEAGAPQVIVRGLTLRGHRGGVVSVLHGSATVEDVLVDRARLAGLVVSTGDMTVARSRVVDTQLAVEGGGGVGILVQHGTIALTDSAIVGGIGAGIASGISGAKDESKVRFERSIVRDVQMDASGGGGAGLSITDNGVLEMTESAVVNVHASGVEVLGGAKATVTRSVVRGVTANGRGDHGDALAVGTGSVVTTSGSTFGGASEYAVLALGAKTSITMSDGVILGPGRGAIAYQGGQIALASVAAVGTSEFGVLAQEQGSLLHAERSLVQGVVPPADDPALGEGAGATFGGALELVDTAVVEATQVGVAIGGLTSIGTPSRASLDHVAVVKPKLSTTGHGRGVEVSAGADLEMTDSIVTQAPEAGIVAGDTSHVVVQRSVVAKTAGATYQHGLVCVDTAVADISSSLIDANAGAGIAFASASGRIDGVTIRGNAVGLAVLTATVKEVDTLPDADLDGTVLVHATIFQGNATKFSGDDLPLPKVRGF